MNSEFITQYHQDGWIVIKNLFSKKEIKTSENKINSFLKRKFKNYVGRDINFTGEKKVFSNINTFHRLHDCSWIKNFSKKKKITNITKSLLSTNSIELRASELFAKPKNYGLRVSAHQDNYYWNVIDSNALTIWIAMSPSSKKNGGVYYYNGSHKFGTLKHVASYAKGSSQKIKNEKFLKKFKKVLPKLDIGDVLVHHCLVVHGSSKNKSNLSRQGWTFQFKDKKSKYNMRLIKEYEKKLYNQIKLREKNK